MYLHLYSVINIIFSGEHANEHIGTRSKVSGDEISQVIATFGPVSFAQSNNTFILHSENQASLYLKTLLLPNAHLQHFCA